MPVTNGKPKFWSSRRVGRHAAMCLSGTRSIILLLVLLCGSITQALALSSPAWREGGVVTDGIPALSERLMRRLNQYLSVRGARFAGWLEDQQGILIRTRFDDTHQIHWVRKAGGQRQQLTFASDPVLNAWPANGAERPQMLFLRDHAGDEQFQLYLADLQSGKQQQLSIGEFSRQGAVVPADDGALFAYYSTARNGRDWDLMSLRLEAQEHGDQPVEQTQKRVLLGTMAEPSKELEQSKDRDLSPVFRAFEIDRLQESSGTWLPLDWSPNREWLLALHVTTGAISLPYMIKADGSEQIPLYAEGEKAAYMDGRFGPEGKQIYLLSNRGREFVSLFLLDLQTGILSLKLDVQHDIESIAISPDRQWLALVTNEAGYSQLRIHNTQNWDAVYSPELPTGIIEGMRFAADSLQLGFSLTGPQHPQDIYSLRLDSDELTRWTFSEKGGLDEATMIQPRLIHYPANKGVVTPEKLEQEGAEALEIPAWYYPAGGGRQQQSEQRAASAVVIYIHGGPEVQARPKFDPMIQFWTQELGVAVLVPNVRGSQGYGRTYVSLDDGYRRLDAVADIGALLDWIEQQDDLDASRVGLYGASYGGYMVLASMAEYSDRVVAGVDINGISDFVTFLRNTSEYRRNHRRGEYGDERRRRMRQFLRQISPLQMIDKIKGPLLVAQGANDPRVPANQSERMVTSLRKQGTEVWYLLAEDEGHGFRKHHNRLMLYASVAQFWCQHLRLECSLLSQQAEST